MAEAERIPLNTLAIAFGLAGLADVWSTAVAVLSWPTLVGTAFWIVAAIAWVWLIVAHAVRGARTSDSFASQLRHPVQGPLAALLPVVGMLLGDELFTFVPWAGRTLVIASIVVSVVFAAWILSFWMRGSVVPDAIHGGYFLPTVAAALVAATAAADVGFRSIATALFVAGLFFWAVMFVLIFARLALRPALPGPLVPTLAIFLAPPAVAGGAWFAIVGHRSNDVALGLAGLTLLMVLVELALIPVFRRLSFSLGFWSFTFPLAAAARLAIGWLSIERPHGFGIGIDALLVVITAVVLAVGVQSVRLVSRGRRRAAEQTLTRADNEAAA
jgi:tellurite resistance protein